MRRWLRDSRGASAIEFALLAPVLLTLLLGTVEIAWMFAQDASQDAAAMRLARDLKVGYANDVRLTPTVARQRMCAWSLLVDCADLDVATRSSRTLTAADLALPPIRPDGRLQNPSLSIAAPDEFAIVIVHRTHRFFTPLIGMLMRDGNLSGPLSLTRTSRIMIRTEPS